MNFRYCTYLHLLIPFQLGILSKLSTQNLAVFTLAATQLLGRAHPARLTLQAARLCQCVRWWWAKCVNFFVSNEE
jgi:hypothetical protein